MKLLTKNMDFIAAIFLVAVEVVSVKYLLAMVGYFSDKGYYVPLILCIFAAALVAKIFFTVSVDVYTDCKKILVQRWKRCTRK